MKTNNITYEIDSYLHWTSGTRVSVILDPVERHVYTTGIVGSGTPEAVYHGRELCLIAGLSADTVPESLEAWLRDHEDTIAALCDAYQGTEIRNGNRVGVWAPEARDLEEGFDADWSHADTYGAVATYWDAYDYLTVDTSAAVQDLIAAGSVQSAAEGIVDEAATAGAILDVDATCEALRTIAQSEIDVLQERLDEDEARDGDADELAELKKATAA